MRTRKQRQVVRFKDSTGEIHAVEEIMTILDGGSLAGSGEVESGLREYRLLLSDEHLNPAGDGKFVGVQTGKEYTRE